MSFEWVCILTTGEEKPIGAKSCIYEIRDRLKELEDFQTANHKQFIEHKNDTKMQLDKLSEKVGHLDIKHTAHTAAEAAASRVLWKSAILIGSVMGFGLGAVQFLIWLYDRSQTL